MHQEPPPSLLSHRDRSARLILFGVLTLLFGGLFLAFVPFLLMGMAAAPARGGTGATVVTILPGVLLYGGLGAVLVALGIGSILARRWARALLLIGAWSTLVVGLVTTVLMGIFLPSLAGQFTPPGARPPPPGSVEAALWVMLGVFGVLLVVVPAVWVLVYGSRHVKATCEARNPAPCWTDACPLPVLAVVVWLAVGIPWMLLTPVLYQGVLPVFGLFISGVPGAIGYLMLALVWGAAAWWLYRLDVRGWWLLVVTLTLYGVSNFLTYQRNSLEEMSALMGLPTAQLGALKGSAFMNWIAWMSVGSLGGMMVYLVAIRRHFSPGGAPPASRGS